VNDPIKWLPGVRLSGKESGASHEKADSKGRIERARGTSASRKSMSKIRVLTPTAEEKTVQSL